MSGSGAYRYPARGLAYDVPRFTGEVEVFAECRYCRWLGARWCWLLASGLLLGLTGLLNFHTLELWWGWDDLHHLIYALEHSPGQYLLRPEIYRDFHVAFFTPWNIVGYDVNLSLFGLHPKGFYLHQILSAWVLSVVTLAFLRLWVDTAWSTAGAALFCGTAPLAFLVFQLMNVHYLEGLVFLVLALLCFFASLRKGALVYAVLGAALYLLSMGCKEIYAPLVLVLPVIPELSWRDRARAVVPYVAAAAIYLVWRKAFLGVLFHASGVSANFEALLTLPGRVPTYVLGRGAVGDGALILFAVVVAGAAVRRRGLGLFVPALMVALFAPFFPVAFRIGGAERSLILIAWIMACTVVLALAHFGKGSRPARAFRVLTLCWIGLAFFSQGGQSRQRLLNTARDYQAVGLFVMEAGPEDVFYLPGPEWAARVAARLKGLLGLGDGPRIVSDARFFEARDFERPIYTYVRHRKQVARLQDDVQKLLAGAKNTWAEKPLTIELQNTATGLRWEFGPYRDQNYTVFVPEREIALRKVYFEGFVGGGLKAGELIVWYRSPEGWTTYSDRLSWSDRENEHLYWTRE